MSKISATMFAQIKRRADLVSQKKKNTISSIRRGSGPRNEKEKDAN